MQELIRYDLGEDPVTRLLRSAPTNYREFRRSENLHVSDVLKQCIRKLALLHLLEMRPPAEMISDSMSIIHACGDAVHDYVKRKVIQAQGDKVWGDWSCACRDTVVPKTFRARAAKTICAKCSTPADIYAETRLVHPDLPIQGSPDILLRHAAIYPIEIKSVENEKLDELTRPDPDHLIQALFYWLLLQENNLPVYDRFSILYVRRAFKFKSPFKEFVVEAPVLISRLDNYLEDVRHYKRALKGGPLPIRTTCATPDAPEAKKCPVCVQCFGDVGETFSNRS